MEDGPPRFPRGSTCPAVLRCRLAALWFRVRGFHPLWQCFPASFPYLQPCFMAVLQPRTDHSARFRLFPLRSPLLGESRLISFPSGTEMFHFPELAPRLLYIHNQVPGHCSRRVAPFRYSRIYGCLAPPRDLSQLTTSFFALQRQGIRLLLLLTCSRRTSSFPCSIVNELADSASAAGMNPGSKSQTLFAAAFGIQS